VRPEFLFPPKQKNRQETKTHGGHVSPCDTLLVNDYGKRNRDYYSHREQGVNSGKRTPGKGLENEKIADKVECPGAYPYRYRAAI
jgi:hypothetical protein